MVLTIFAGVARFERELILERTAEGRAAARARGKRFGQPEKLSAEQAALCDRLLSEGRSPREVCAMFGVHRSTIYRTMRRRGYGQHAQPAPGGA